MPRALQKAIFTVITHNLYPLIDLICPEFVMNTPEHSGKMLADVALSVMVLPHGRIYVPLVKGKSRPSQIPRNWGKTEMLRIGAGNGHPS